ncbi:MAG: hypothetical protein PWR27_1189 [Petroclostridium sp.]|jgi:polyferredoxin|uniref:4Fe-4S binding protein n=1 Tax=Petroclostridium xylanilyticum TaxID=1792311 RepID=UPI000B97ED5C|nr:4Fe-4S binding protein [Petroclostridium xylanilyticum]MBZ4645733.1 hypothetical protein [Clostridia bacterium]MDK2810480.1 hypothetical protein [Petroclostridium sp.]
MKKLNKIIHKWSWLLLITYCIVGLIYPVVGVIALVCMLAPVGMAFFKGRMWCGNYCPRGSFNDIILSKLSRKKGIPKLFTSIWFRTIFLIILMSTFALQLIFAWGNAGAIGIVFVRMIIITTLLTIILGITFNQRTWCAFCPMGTMAHYVSKLNPVKSRIKHVTFDEAKCVNCKICTKHCPIGIDVLDHKKQGKVLHADCLKCEVCVEQCPKKALEVA